MRAPIAACCVETPERRVDTGAIATHTGRPPEPARASGVVHCRLLHLTCGCAA